MNDSVDKLFEEYFFQSQKVEDMLVQFRKDLDMVGNIPLGGLEKFSQMNEELLQVKEKLIEELRR